MRGKSPSLEMPMNLGRKRLLEKMLINTALKK
jgi:hypothetical protein